MNSFTGLFFLFFLQIVSSYGQFTFTENVFQLDEFNDRLTISDILQKDKEGHFNVPFKVETYKSLRGQEANWIQIGVPALKELHYLTIENSLFEELDFYLVNDNEVVKLKNLKEENYFRFPIIQLQSEKTPCKIFVRTKDEMSFRTEFMIKNYNQEAFNKQQQLDYFIIGAYSLSLLVLLISATILFLYKKEFVILWYVVHLVILIVEYFISTGAFSQWFVDNSFILKWGLDQMAFVATIFALSEFYRNYYNYSNQTRFCERIYRVISVISFLGIIYVLADGFLGNIFNVEFFAQSVLDYASLISLIIHLVLVYYKEIPIYLFVASLFPVLGVFANTGDFKNLFDNPNVTYFLFQSVYLGILIKVIVIILYIIKQSIDKEFVAISLQEENSKLKNEFQEKLSFNQEKQQNTLVSDVHDSFGGYLEALKLRLVSKKNLTPDVENILNDFRKDYKFLLNSLYIPNVNSNNFIASIEDYCMRMNEISPIEIDFKKEGMISEKLPQNIAKFLFKGASELTTNSIKYSKATKITVLISSNSNTIFLKIKDDGVGFNPSKIKASSFGIKNLKERVELQKGVFDLNTFENRGTEINVSIPI